MKKILLALVALFATYTLSAQELRWGATWGLNFANVHCVKQNSSNCYLGLNFGVKAEMTFDDVLSEGFYTDARLLYTIKGGNWAGFRHNLGYIELPLNAGYRYAITDDVKLFGGLGPYFALGVAGSSVVKESHTKTKTDLFGISYKRFDFGLNYNVGVELYDKWQVFMGFEHGVINAFKNELEGEKRKGVPMNFYIGAAYMF